MLDTIRGKITVPWKKGVFDKVIPKWSMSKKTTVDKDSNIHVSWQALHEDGLWINGSDEVAHIIQCSLPRLLFRDNTNLIRNQEQLDQSFSQLRLLMLQVLETDQIPRWTRLDMVWNFIGSIDEYIACFQNTKHPKVRSPVRTYQGESITWSGKYTTIQIYDKLQEKNIQTGYKKTIVRAEMRKSIPKAKYNDTKSEDLTLVLCEAVMGGYLPTFEKCYKYYREQMTLLSPKDIPVMSTRSPLDFLAYLQANGLMDPQGVPLVDLYLANKSERSKRRIQRELKSRILRHKFISFHKLLPEETTPVPIGYDDIVRCA